LFDLEDEVTRQRKKMINATLTKAEERRTSEEDVEVDKRRRYRNGDRRKEVVDRRLEVDNKTEEV
jgi:hypothetical protein